MTQPLLRSLCFMLVVTTTSFASAAPLFEQVDVWTSGEDGYHTYRIPSLLVTEDKSVLAFCEGRKTAGGDHGDLDLLVKRSTDGGRTWSQQQIVYEEGGDAKITIGNPCPVVDAVSKTIWLPFCRDNRDVLVTSSDDDGKTWSKPRDVSDSATRPEWTWVATGPGIGIQLHAGKYAGRLVIPCDHKLCAPDGKEEMNSHMMLSDDRGRTWRIGAPIQTGGNECQVIERADGSLLVNTRMQGDFQGYRGIATSTDGGASWTPIAQEKQLPCPKCQASLVKVLDAQGEWRLLFSNPDPRPSSNDKPSNDRSRLTVRLSWDEGKTWPAARRITEAPSAYSCLAQLPDRTLLCLYETGEKRAYERIRLARFDWTWLTAEPGQLPAKSSSTAAATSGKQIDSDICIFGGTSGGIAAAVQASRLGKKVVLLEPGKHLGGMTSGGLSAVDIGDPRTVGGIAREYFTRLVARYDKQLEWDKPFVAAGGGPATGGAYSIEPHVAEDVFNVMIREAGVPVHLGAYLKSVKKDGARITELTTEDGLTIRAKMFIDATYEGDLMAKAGVTYTLEREGNKKYGETYNGIYYDAKYEPRTNHQKPGPHGRVPGGQGVWDRDFPLDPYMTPGDPKSGLLPLLQAGEPGTPGESAPGVQAYCYRLCLTKSADKLPIAPPPNYDRARYELVARFIAACQSIGDDMDLRWFSKHDPLPNDKWDFNTATFGGNLPGASWAWAEASYLERDKIAKEHENYHRGLLYFLATDERVPEKVRTEMKQFGLPRDEFTDRGGWPHQLYIREARRMVSDLVLTEHHTFGREVAKNSVSLGSYGTDAHEIRRIVKDGVVIREGKLAGGRGGAPPYPIGYAAIVPKAAECTNLFVTFALSASHPAFASIRMEPVFMATSQSAATAAALAIDDGVPVQQVEYTKLRKQLDEDKQIVEWQLAKLQSSTTVDEEKWSKQVADDAKQDRTTIIYDGITPNKMVCDTTLRKLPDGRWVLFFLAGGDTEPSPKNYTAVSYSSDEGKTWSKAEPFDTTFPREGQTIGQGPTELMILDDQCTLFFSTHAKHWNTGWQSWIMRSADSGKTWDKPEPAPSRLAKRTFLRGHIVTRDGRIMVPFQHYIGPNDEQDKPILDRKFTNPRNGVIISTDGGKTWSEHGNVALTKNDQYFGWAEITLGELNDGRIVMLLRADKLGGVLYMAESTDGGLTWPELAHKTDIPNPGSKATLYALGNDAFALLHNPNPAHRSPMAMWVTFDGLKTWPYRRVLQAESVDGPKGRMNYPDGFVTPDKQWLHFAFDDNRHRAVYYGAKLPPLPKK